MNKLLPIILAAAGTACSTTRPDTYPVTRSFHPDGSGGGIFPDRDAWRGAEGMIFEYEAGDRIEVVLQLDSRFMHLEEPTRNVLVLDRPARISADDQGLLVSVDGGPWRTVLDAFTGSFQVGLSADRTAQANRAGIVLTAEPR